MPASALCVRQVAMRKDLIFPPLDTVAGSVALLGAAAYLYIQSGLDPEGLLELGRDPERALLLLRNAF